MRHTFLAFGILAVYTVSSIYFERTVNISDPRLKTAFSIVYFIICVSPLIYAWVKAKIQESLVAPILVLCLAVLYISALTRIPIPLGRNYPDVDFHAAKVLYCSTGHFFNDPITSYPSIYPPVYHIIVGSIMRVWGSNNSWYVLSRFHILTLVVLFLSVYFLANSLFNPRIGLLSVLFLGAVFDMPNQSGMFFPTPFLLALTVMVNSVTLVYLGLRGKRWCFYPAGLVTGLAVTIWPAFLPVAIVLLVVIFFTPEKKFRHPVNLLNFVLTFLIFPLIVWIPQYLLLSKHHLLGHQSIGQFKGVPGVSWFLDFVLRFILLGGFDRQQQWVTVLFGTTYVISIALVIWVVRSSGKKELLKERFLKLFFISMLVALPLIHYVFSYAYSRRVQVLFSIIVIIVAGYYLVARLNKKYRLWGAAFIVWVITFTNGWNVYMAHKYVPETKYRYEIWSKYATRALQFIESNTAFGEYLFATEKTYRILIMGNLVRFNLMAHRSGNYYSLNPDLSEKLQDHYNTILNSNDFNIIKRILDYNGIRHIIIYEGEQATYPGLGLLYENCVVVYRDENYSVLVFNGLS